MVRFLGVQHKLQDVSHGGDVALHAGLGKGCNPAVLSGEITNAI